MANIFKEMLENYKISTEISENPEISYEMLEVSENS